MEKIKIKFLGTGDAKPTKKRNHTSIILSYKNENILVDCGEGTQRQLKVAGVSLQKINRILITHKHGDHTFGLPGLLSSLMLDKFQGVMKIYGPKGIKDYLEVVKKMISVYAGYHIKLEVHEVSGKFVDEKDFYIEAKEMSHGTPCNAYSFVVKDKLRLDKSKIKKLKIANSPLLGKLQKGEDVLIDGRKIKSSQVSYLEKGKKITFILDTSTNKNEVPFAKNSDLLVAESTFMADSEHGSELAKEYHHMTSKDAAEIAKKSGSKKLILTHISQRYEKDFSPILKEARKVFKNTVVAEDFLEIEI